MGPNKSFIILVKNVISLPYSVQRKKAYVLINFTILSASKNPCAYPLLSAFPFTVIYMKPCSSSPSILFPFSISIDECDENFCDAFGDSSGDAGGDAVSGDAGGDAVSGDAVSGDAGDEVWRGLATGGVDNNKLGGNSVGVADVVKLGVVLIKKYVLVVYIYNLLFLITNV
jgi:hypothetical protein